MGPNKLMKRTILVMGLMIFVSFTMDHNSAKAYIMPAQQILGFLSKNFMKINSAEILFSIRQVEERAETSEKIFDERIFLKSPNLFYFETVESEREKQYLKDVSFFRLLISNRKENLEIFLSSLGINLEEVAFTRIDGIVAYRIGERSEDSPKILIEKERFLPILLMYRSGNDYNGNIISVRFKDYRKLDQIWYPYEITVNLLQPMVTNRFEDEEPTENLEEEQLRKIIKAFEEKYHQD